MAEELWTEVGGKGFYAKRSEKDASGNDISTTYATKTELSGKQDTISDLSDIRSGAAAGATAYQLPTNGIPDTDLSQGVQDSLSLADTAVQPAALNDYVQKETGKGLSTNDYTTAEKDKLANIDAGAEVNVQADWTETDNTEDSYIQNKPTLSIVATSGDYNDLINKPQSLQISGGTNVDVTESNNTLTIDAKVKNNVTAGHFASLDSNGNFVDSGVDSAVVPSTAASNNKLITNTELQQAIANFGGFEVVSLDQSTGEPDVQSPSDKIIYLTKDSQSAATDPYTEWIYQNSSWEVIGETSVDLTGYIKSVSMAGGTAISPAAGSTTIDLPAATMNSGTGVAGIMSGADKEKLEGIAAGAQVNVKSDWAETNTSSDSYIENKPTPMSIQQGTGISITEVNNTITIASTVDPSTKADKVSGATNGNFAGLDANGNLTDSGSSAADFATAAQGALAATAVQDANYVHTDNNYTTTEKTKLSGIEDGAQVNVQADWAETDNTADSYIQNKPASLAIVAGTGISITEDQTTHEMTIASTVDTSTKADKVSGATNGNFAGLDSNGNLTDSGSSAADFATAAQGALAATAVQDANYVHTDNNYTTAEQTKLSGIETGAQVNVQADWTETNTSADSYIQNKPTIPAAQIQSDWTQSDNTALDYIKNKPASMAITAGTGISVTEDPTTHDLVIASTVDTSTKADKVTNATSGNFAGLDVNGNLTDSGSSASDFKTVQTAVSDPTASGTAVSFIDTISQNTNGEISVTKKTVQTVSASTSGVGGNDGLMTAADKEKLDSVASGAEANVQADWAETNTSADSYINNKPTVTNIVAGSNITIQDTGSGVEISATVPAQQQANWTESDSTAASYIQNKPQNLVQDASYVHTDNNYTTAEQTKLSGIETGAEVNVQADWAETDNTADSYIQNKPAALAIVAGTGISITENQSTHEMTIAATADPANKADKVSNATNGNLAGLDANGNLTDSGYAASDFASADVIPSDANAQNQLVSSSTLTAALANFGGFKVVTGDVTTGEPILPSGESPSTKIIYLTKDTSVVGTDQYREWIWDEGDSSATPPVAAHWELIGDTSMNLNGYVQFPASYTPGNIVEFDSNDTIADAGTTVSALENVIETVKVNGSALTPDANKAVDVTVPITEIQVNSTTVTPTNHVVDITVPAQVNADWNSSSGVSEILNKPTLSTVATSGDYDDLINKPTIPAAQVNADWNASSGVAEILNKPTPMSIQQGTGITITEANNTITIAATANPADKADKVANATSGNFAGLDSNGNLTDSGSSASDFKTVQTAVTDPTASGTAISFIDTISQNTNGEISVTKKTVQTVTASTSGAGGNDGVMTAADKEKLDGIEAGAEVNVKPDWNAASGSDAEILNKPASLAITAGTGITVTEDQTTHDLVIACTVDASGKADKVTSATADNFASLTSAGNLADSGYSATSFIQGVTVDSGSPLTPVSGVVNIDLSGKVDVVSGKGLSTNDYTQADKDVVDNAADVIPSDATSSNQLVSTSTMNSAIANLGGFKVSTGTGADNHPDEANPDTHTVYLVKDTSVVGADKYNEWICTNTTSPATWEKIGDTTLDLSGYVEYPSTHVDTHIVAFGPNSTIVDTGATVSSLTNSVETVSIGSGSSISPTSGTTDINIPLAANSNGTGSDGAMSGADKVKLDGIADGAEVNVQADWNETVTTSDAYIANKPTIPAAANDGVLSITVGSSTTTFSADQSSNESITISNATYDDTASPTTYTDGLMTGQDKEKLDGISDGATCVTSSSTNGHINIDGTDTTVYTHPTGNGNRHIPNNGSSGSFLRWAASGEANWATIAGGTGIAVTAPANIQAPTTISSTLTEVPLSAGSGIDISDSGSAVVIASKPDLMIYKASTPLTVTADGTVYFNLSSGTYTEMYTKGSANSTISLATTGDKVNLDDDLLYFCRVKLVLTSSNANDVAVTFADSAATPQFSSTILAPAGLTITETITFYTSQTSFGVTVSGLSSISAGIIEMSAEEVCSVR